MRPVGNVLGEGIKLGFAFLFAGISVGLSIALPSGSLARYLHISSIPCLGLGILSGPLYVLWISLAYRMCGRWYGVTTAVLISSFLLLSGPWYGITNPSWFGVYGLISFIVLGLVTERINGGVASVGCLAINWLALWAHKAILPNPIHIALLVLVATFLSGFIFDKLVSMAMNRLGFRLSSTT